MEWSYCYFTPEDIFGPNFQLTIKTLKESEFKVYLLVEGTRHSYVPNPNDSNK